MGKFIRAVRLSVAARGNRPAAVALGKAARGFDRRFGAARRFPHCPRRAAVNAAQWLRQVPVTASPAGGDAGTRSRVSAAAVSVTRLAATAMPVRWAAWARTGPAAAPIRVAPA
jgi:hypothetical protein